MGNILDDWFGPKDDPEPTPAPKDPVMQYVPAGQQLPQGPVSQATEYYQPRTPEERYAMFSEGRVPYSYYAAGIPTKEGELDIMRQAMPENFSRVDPPPPSPAPEPPSGGGGYQGTGSSLGDFFSMFLGGLFGNLGIDNPFGQGSGGTQQESPGLANIFQAFTGNQASSGGNAESAFSNIFEELKRKQEERASQNPFFSFNGGSDDDNNPLARIFSALRG